ncbi:conserved domain protein, partial [delta proteobacterium NaphS2]
TCKAIISKVFEQEERYWAEDEKLDEIYSETMLRKNISGKMPLRAKEMNFIWKLCKLVKHFFRYQLFRYAL